MNWLANLMNNPEKAMKFIGIYFIVILCIMAGAVFTAIHFIMKYW